MAKEVKELSRAKVLAVYHAEGTHVAIGAREGVSPSCVGAIKRGEYQRAVTGATRQHATRKHITMVLVQKMIQAEGSCKQRAAQLGVCRTTVRKYLRKAGAYGPHLAGKQPRENGRFVKR